MSNYSTIATSLVSDSSTGFHSDGFTGNIKLFLSPLNMNLNHPLTVICVVFSKKKFQAISKYLNNTFMKVMDI